MTVIDRLRGATRHGLFRALLLSLVVLAIPITGTFVIPVQWANYEALLWLLALVPGFLLAYHKGWRGVATSLAFGMAVLSVTYAVAQVLGRHVPDLLFGVVALYILFALMTGWLAERLHRDIPPEEVGGAAFTDAATGLPNRRHVELHLEIEFNAAQRGRPLTVVALGLDHFKNFTTRHGVIAADEVMRVMGVVLKKNTRRMNLSGRYSEDEFLCVLGGTDEDGALVFMSRFHSNLAAESGQLALPTVSAGVASFGPGILSWADLISGARDALNRARKDGPGRVRVHGRSMAAAALPQAIASKEDQPRTAMPEGRGAGRKALVVVDEPPVRALLARYLTDHGFKVAQVSNVVDGVQCLSIEYDLLVTDISLTEGVGAELVRAAKLRWPSIQVLGLAQMGESTAAIESLNAGVDRYIEKPLDLPKLRQHITELLNRHDRLVMSVLENRQLSLEVQAERAEAVNALRRSEEEYRSVVESLQDIIFRLDETGIFTFLNWAWSGITEHPLDDSLGRPMTEFVHPVDRPQVAEDLANLLGGRLEEARGEIRIVARDGTDRWVELRARRIFGSNGAVAGATGTMDDITRRKLAEHQLRRSEAASRAILAALPDYVFGLSRTGVFVSYEATEDDKPAPVGLPLEEELPADIARLYRASLERLFEDRVLQVLEYKREEGGVIDEFEARLALIGDDEAVAIVRNVSDRKRLEDQLRQSQKLEAIGRLAGGLAHDFNNLLTVVQGNAHLLIEEFGDNEPAREFAVQINSAAGRGADLVRQLLAFGRKQVMQPRVMNLNAVVTSVQSLLPRLLGEDVELRVKLANDLWLVRADPSQIEHVLVNLAAFVKLRLRNGGTLEIATANVTAPGEYDPDVVNLQSDALVLLTVTDNGPSLDEQTRTHVFEPFVGAIGTPQAGLGLATVFGIVTQSGGVIRLDDAPEAGARFRIFFPKVEAN